MKYALAPLPYAYNALEPYIDTKTMELHHDKHQQTYIDGLNKALEAHPELQNIPLVKLLSQLEMVPEEIRTAVRNNGGGQLNHSMFWLMMKNGGGELPKESLAAAINKRFGTFDVFKAEFDAAAKSRFGSGWAWLSVNKKGDLEVSSTANQDTPFSEGCKPLLGLDVWEHAYYLKYNNRRVDYIQAWWHVVDWEHIEENYRLVK